MRACGIREEREDGDHLLEVLGAIIIAVVILFFFREQIIEIFRNAMGKVGTKVDNMFNDVSTTGGTTGGTTNTDAGTTNP